MKSEWWIAWRMLKSNKQLFSSASMLGLIGLMLGVAFLMVSMAVMSGYEKTLKNILMDVSGHLQVIRKGREGEDWREFEQKIRAVDKRIIDSTRFLSLEAVLADKGQVQGVMMQGLDGEKDTPVLNLLPRVIEGQFDLKGDGETASAMLGKELAKKMQLKVGDKFKVVIPISDDLNPTVFKRRVATLKLSGILDLGKIEFDERVVVTNLKVLQELAQIGDRYHGLILKLTDPEQSREVGLAISESMKGPYWVQDWRDINGNLLQSIEIERAVIFLVVLIIVIAAAFNVSSSLFISVVRRYREISILKTMGFSARRIVKIFSLQGVMIGILGLVGGSAFGYILCLMVPVLIQKFHLLPASVYHLNSIEVVVRGFDMFAIVIATLIISFVATLAPAYRGSKLQPVEGLRYE